MSRLIFALQQKSFFVDKQLRFKSVKKLLKQFECEIDQTVLNKVQKVCEWQGSLQTIRSHLEDATRSYHGFITDAADDIKEAWSAIAELESYLKHSNNFGVSQEMHIDVGLSPQVQDFKGPFFEMILRHGKRYILIGAGGEYSTKVRKLRQRWRMPDTFTQRAIGVEINLDQLARWSPSGLSPNVTNMAFGADRSVLVCVSSTHQQDDYQYLAAAADMQAKIMRRLWTLNIRVVGIYEALTQADITQRRGRFKCGIVVGISETSIGSNTVAVHTYLNDAPGAHTEIPTGRLETTIRDLQARPENDATGARHLTASPREGAVSSHSGRFNTNFFLPAAEKKSPSDLRTTKRLIDTRVLAPAMKQLFELSNVVEVVCVVLPPDTFRDYTASFELSSIDDTESFDGLVHSPKTKKWAAYLQSIHRQVRKLVNESGLKLLMLTNNAGKNGELLLKLK